MTYDRFFSRAAVLMQESPIRKMGTVGARMAELISFAPGYPAPDTFPWDGLREIAGDLLGARADGTLQYGATRGYRPLVESLRDVLGGRGIVAATEELLVTTGSQQGLDLVARVLLDPGDVVLVELPTYTGAITAFRNVQASLVGVPQDADGVNLDALDEAWQRATADGRRVRFLYVVPNFQNPTGLLIGLEKRQRLLEWAARRDVLVVEDDPYGELYFDAADAQATRPLKTDDREGRVVYLSSFSKTLAPGFRVAWTAGPAPLVAKLEIAKQAADLCTGALDQRIVHEAIRRGVLAAQAPALREHYGHKRRVMERALAASLGDLLRWPEPRGGFFLWVTLPGGLDGEAVLARALAHQVSFVVGSAFFVDGKGQSQVRLSFSHPTPGRLEEGVARLARAVREALDARDQSGVSAVTGTGAPRG